MDKRKIVGEERRGFNYSKVCGKEGEAGLMWNINCLLYTIQYTLLLIKTNKKNIAGWGNLCEKRYLMFRRIQYLFL